MGLVDRGRFRYKKNMGKVRKINPARIRKITGGKDPTRLVEEFLVRRGYNPDECLEQRTSDICTWAISITEDEELEISLEGISRPPETTLYMGLNVMAVPLKEANNFLHSALTVADTLIGAKLSLVNYDLVLSITVYTANMPPDELDYYFELITRQKITVQEAIIDELSS